MHTIPLDTVALKKRKRNGRAVIWQAIEKAGAMQAYMPGAVIMILFGLAECFTLPSFFVCSLWFAVVQQRGKRLKGGAAGMICLMLLKLIWGLNVNIGAGIIYAAMVLAVRKPFSSHMRMYLFLCLAVFLSGLCQWSGAGTVEQAFRLFGGAMLSVCIMPSLMRCVEVLNQHDTAGVEDDLLCLSIPAMILFGGAAHIGLFAVNAGSVAAGFAVIMIGWSCGSLMGAMAGICAGFAVVSGGLHVVHMIYLPVAGMLCGCFRDKRRLTTASVYAAATAALVYVLMQDLPDFLLINQMTAMLLFLLIPNGKMKEIKKKLARFQGAKPKDNEYLRIRMLQWVNNIRQLANVLPTPQIAAATMEEESEILAEKLCDQCEKLPICWHEEYEKTKKGMQAVLGCQDVELPVINAHFGTCDRLASVPKYLQEIQANRKEILDRNRMAAFGRDMMETHLLSLSQAALLISLEGMMVDEEETELEQMISAGLEKMHFSGSILYVKKIDGHVSVGIRSDKMVVQPAITQGIIKQIRLTTGRNMYPVEQKGSRLILEETPHFDLMTGQASVSAGLQEKGSIPANGDAVLIRALSGSRMLFAISDGMGHGLQARNESKRTLEMLAVCLHAGYDTEQTMRVVNGAMLSATGGETFATLDLGVVDLWTGETRISKLGACSSFVVQGQKISRLTGEALPLGILEHVYPAEKVIQLEENDRILMMSDGVADLFATDDEVIRLIHKYQSDMPQTMAEMILQEAMDRQQYQPADDMTVLCVQLVSRYTARQYKKSIPA